MTYMLLLNCALNLVEEIILYYDARLKKHQKNIKIPLTDTLCHAYCIVSWGTALITVSTILFKFQVSLKYSILTADPTYFWKSAHTCRLPT